MVSMQPEPTTKGWTASAIASLRPGSRIPANVTALLTALHACKQDAARNETDRMHPAWKTVGINRVSAESTFKRGLASLVNGGVSGAFGAFTSHGDTGALSNTHIAHRNIHSQLFARERCPCSCLRCFFAAPTPQRSATAADACARAPPTRDLLVQLGAQSTLWSLHAALAADFWLRPTEGLSEAITELSLAAGLGESGSVSMALHLRRGDRTSGPEMLEPWSAAEVAAVIRARLGPPNCPSGGGQREPWCDRPVIIASDDQAFATEVRLQLATIDQLRVVLLEEVRPASIRHEADYLLAAAWLIAGAPLVMASAGSNFGRLIFWLASARQRRVPAVLDMDGEWTSSQMADGYFPCSIEWRIRPPGSYYTGHARSATKGLCRHSLGPGSIPLPCHGRNVSGVLGSHGTAACCPVACGECGGVGCQVRPGGQDCCASSAAKRPCAIYDPPCVPARGAGGGIGAGGGSWDAARQQPHDERESKPMNRTVATSYRLGDAFYGHFRFQRFTSATGETIGGAQLENAMAREHPDTIGAAYLRQHNGPKDIATLKAVTESHCAQYSYPLDLASSTALHLRVGDVVCGTTKGEVWRRPFPPRAYAVFTNRSAHPHVYVFAAPHFGHQSSRSCERESGEHVDAVLAATGGTAYNATDADYTLCSLLRARTVVLGHNSFFADVAGWLRSGVDPRVSAKEKPCERHGGIAGSHGVPTCCASSCGECGGSGCEARPGGQRACCALAITRTCSSSTPAPCRPAADDGLVVCEATQPCVRHRFQ